MPIFEYHCNDCGKDFEELVFNEEDAIACPACGKTNTGKLMSCCRFKTAGPSGLGATTRATTSSGGSSCAGCTSSNCSSCH